MSEEFPGISKSTYMDSKGRAQDGLTYDILTRINNNVDGLTERVNNIEVNCKSKKKMDKILTGTMALFGGALAFFIQAATFKKF